MNIGYRIGISFALAGLLLATLGLYNIDRIETLSQRTEALYRHPYSVSTAILRIDGAVKQMQIIKRDQGRNGDPAATRRLSELQQAVDADFTLLQDRFLGDPRRIDEAKRQYDSWQSLANEEKALAGDSADPERLAALGERIERERRALETMFDNLIRFADDKAEVFLQDAQTLKTETLRITGALMLFAALAGITIAIVTIRSIVTPLREVIGVANRVAKGDLSLAIEVTRKDETGELMHAIKSMVADFSQAICLVRAGADELVNASNQVSATAQSMTRTATQQANDIEGTTQAIEQLSGSVSQNAENARATSGMAKNSANEAEQGGDAVSDTVSVMTEVVSKIRMVEDLAYKTNLLSLNAAIEAARAGEQGKGFTVVAAEVRRLAEQSRESANQINQLANTSMATAENAGVLLKAMVPTIVRTAELIGEISDESRDQAHRIGQINQTMLQLDRAAQQNAASSKQLAATSERLKDQANHLQQAVSFFST